MARDLGRHIAVTGGASGMGRAVCEALSESGLSPIVIDINGQGAADVAATAGGAAIEFDLASLPESVDALRAGVKRVTSTLAGIVNAAGVSSDQHFPAVSPEHWQRVLAINLTAPFFVIQALEPLLERPGSSIVNITSAEARGVYSSSEESTPAYAAAKAGLRLVTECLASDLGRDGIRVNAVEPGLINTPMTQGMRAQLDPTVQRIVPTGRWGEPADVAHVIAFLLSTDADYVNGVSIPIDGGLTLGLTSRTFDPGS